MRRTLFEQTTEQTRMGERLLHELDRLHQQFENETEADRYYHRRSETDAAARVNRHAQRIGDKLREAREFIQSAKPLLDATAPVPEPPVSYSRVELHLRISILYQQPESERLNEFHASIRAGDRLTYDAFVHAPDYMKLLPDGIVRQGMERWSAKFNPIPIGPHSALLDLVTRIGTAINRAESILASV